HLAITHFNTNSNDELINIPTGVLSVVATITSGNGDMVISSVDFGAAVVFEDDGPAIDISLNENAMLVVDETDGETAAGEIDPVGGNLGSNTLLAASMSSSAANPGSDGEASRTYALILNRGNTNTNLVDTLTGENIAL